MIDIVGHDLSKPYPVLDICEWEDMQIDAELPSVGLLGKEDIEEYKKIIQKLAQSVMRLSAEIFRLRLTYGEEVWTSVYHSEEENKEIRRVHEEQK